MPIFVIHKHHARNLHYDLRLEMNGVLKSWAVPKCPSKDPKVKRLAIQVPDHARSYAKFEGTLPKGTYGAGKVEIWDNGTYTLEEKKQDTLVVNLKGKKLTGKYTLVKFKKENMKKQWLFFKMKD
jgi:DNA ligase D-like protein (predicted 3'-phosphoesterase)